jgi:hypothetical protein
MAKVWLVRRRGGQWVAPGGAPAFEAPLAKIQFALDLGIHRRLDDETPLPAPELAPEPPESLERVMVEVGNDDLAQWTLSGFRPGVYDSALSPRAAADRLRRLARTGSR